MRHEIVFAPVAAQDLVGLRANERAAVLNAIEVHLRHEPKKTSKSRIKQLRQMTQPQYRLRVDDVRVYYDVNESTVEILAVLKKSQTGIWLAQFGVPDKSNGEPTDEKSSAI